MKNGQELLQMTRLRQDVNDQCTSPMVFSLTGNQEKPIKTSVRNHCIPTRVEKIYKSDNYKASTWNNKSFQKLVAVNIGPNTLENTLVLSSNM